MTPDATPAAELLRTTVGRVGLATASDGELVRRFADQRDDLAFAELVHRFAPAVYALCRRRLTDPHTIDDAFQAVFVLLARKAGSLTHPDRVGGWLAGAADRIARTARRRQVKRSGKLRPLDSVPEPAVPPPEPSDLRAVLDDELAKLPPHYREVVLLCDVDGVARRTAAAKLSIPVATLGHRLTRARAVLGRRLLRRGVLVAAGGVLTGGSLAHPPPRLLASAVRMALAAGPPTELLSLLTPVVPPMVRAKQLLAVVAGLAVLGGAITGVVVLMQKPTPPPTSDDQAAKPTESRKPETPVTRAVSLDEAAKMHQPKPRLPQDRTGAVAFTKDGTRMVSAPRNWNANDTKISVYDTTKWERVATLDVVQVDGFIDGVAITADGKRVFISWSSDEDGLRVWDTTTDRFEEKRLAVDGKYSTIRLKLSPDGKVLAGYLGQYPDKHFIRLWDVTTGEVLRTLTVPRLPNDTFTFTDNGKMIAALHNRDHKGEVRAEVVEWDVATGTERKRVSVWDAIGTERGSPLAMSVAYTPDGKQVIVGGGVTLPEYPKDKMDPKEFIINTFPWSGSVWVIDRESGNLVKTLVDCRHDLIRFVRLSADGKKLFVQPTLQSRWDRTRGPDDEFVELQQWDVATWELDWVKIVPTAERWKLLDGAK